MGNIWEIISTFPGNDDSFEIFCPLLALLKTLTDSSVLHRAPVKKVFHFSIKPCPVSWRQEAETLQLEFSATVKLVWCNYEPLNEELDCPVASGTKSQSTWRWFQEMQGPLCPGWGPEESPSRRTSHAPTQTGTPDDINVHQGCLAFRHGSVHYWATRSHVHLWLYYPRIYRAWWFDLASH